MTEFHPNSVVVSIVIVSYNTREWLSPCLTSIPAAAGTLSTEVIIVDNASVDGSADAIASNFPNVRLIRNSKNVGFGRAVNQGAAVATGKYVLLLNPDGYLKPSAIEALVVFARENPQHVICGGRTVTPAGELDPRSCWGAPTLWSLFCSAALLSTLRPGSRLFDPESMGWFGRDRVHEVDVVTGCLLLASLSDWRQLGGFDERYFVYGEDADLCMRAAAQTGRTCAITPEAEMVHAVGASSASRPDKLELLLNGRIALARTHLRGWKGAAGAALIVAGVWVRSVLERLGFNSGTNWREVWRRRERWRQGYKPVPVR
jgi:N-acetylglucosaminyl-diphospho-decaprenol L-rhamnosyltransferase